jgi:chloramphenicol-sensitive protein RarD
LTWGLFPLYFHALGGVPAPEVVAHRIVWSLAFLADLVTALRRWRGGLAQLRSPGALSTLAVTAVLISSNWLTYVCPTLTSLDRRKAHICL